jgi:hypothetical protein
MQSNAYMKPEKIRGISLLNAYGAFLEDHDFNIESQRLISDLYLYFKEETNINFLDFVADCVDSADNWTEEE